MPALISIRAAFGFLLLCQLSQTLVVLDPPDLAGRLFPTPEYSCLRHSVQPATGIVVNIGDVNTTEDLASVLADKIVYIQSDLKAPIRLPGIPNERVFLMMQQYNALAVIFTNPLTNVPGASESLIDSPDACHNLTIPGVEMGYLDGLEFTRLLAENGGTLLARVDIGDPNPWRVARHGAFMKIWQTLMGAIAFACAAGALAKLIAFIRAYGPQISVAQLSLLFLFIVRLLYIAIDPIYSGFVLLVYQAHMLVSIHFPFAIMTTLLFSLYYQELLSASRVEIATFLTKFRIPYLILSFIVIGVEVATSVLRAIRFSNIGLLTTVAGVLYAVILFLLAVFFFVVGIRVLHRLKAGAVVASSNAKAAQRTLRSATILVMCCGVFNLIWILGSLFITIRQIFWSIVGHFFSWTLVFVGIFGLSITQIIVLRAPKTSFSLITKSATRNASGSNKSGSGPKPDEDGSVILSAGALEAGKRSYTVTDSLLVMPSATSPSLVDMSSSSARDGVQDAKSAPTTSDNDSSS